MMANREEIMTVVNETGVTADVDVSRRQFLVGSMAAAGAATLLGGASMSASTSAWAAGSDKPEKPVVNVGFIPLTDCASVVVAALLGFDKKYGIKINVSKEASWAGVRDKLINGELDAAHVLYGLIYGVHPGRGRA
jgi:nitrate/nitrite transport system substrate-binding protein